MERVRIKAGGLLRDVAIGALLGLAILGVGGRIAMRAVAHAVNQPPSFTPSGTLTVVAAGVAAGVAGALLYALSRMAAAWLAGSTQAPRGRDGWWVRPLRLLLFAILLALVTARGLRGSAGPLWSFWLLVAAYGVALELTLMRRVHAPAPPSPERSLTTT